MKQLRQNGNSQIARIAVWGAVWLVIAGLILTGCSAALRGGDDTPPAGDGAVQIPDEAQRYVALSQGALAQQLDINQDAIALDSITEPAAADGTYIVTLAADGQRYEYQGRNQKVTLVSDPLPAATRPAHGVPHVTLTLNDAVATAVASNTIPAVEQTDQTPYWALLPQYVQVSLTGYTQPDSIHMPKLYVYPVADLKDVNEMAADQVNALEEMLAKQPDPATVQQPLPFLPLFNAQPMLSAQIQYLDFANGSGIRYLTQIGQAAGPITNQELLYTFQGLTDDGAYYVAAIFPVAQSNLPADTASADTSFPDGFETYIQGVKGALETAAADSFTPNLNNLDDLIGTVAIQ